MVRTRSVESVRCGEASATVRDGAIAPRRVLVYLCGRPPARRRTARRARSSRRNRRRRGRGSWCAGAAIFYPPEVVRGGGTSYRRWAVPRHFFDFEGVKKSKEKKGRVEMEKVR